MRVTSGKKRTRVHQHCNNDHIGWGEKVVVAWVVPERVVLVEVSKEEKPKGSVCAVPRAL